MTLSDGEKIIIFMLRDIYKHLGINGEIDPDFITSAISSGNLWALRWELSGILEANPCDEKIVMETCDILDMWRILERNYSELVDDEKSFVDSKAFGGKPDFQGFDANNEDHFGVAQFLVEKMNRYENFKNRALNSHSPSIDSHRRMLIAYKAIRSDSQFKSLKSDEIIQILNEQVHPSQR